MRFLFLGDVVGRAGRDAVIEAIPELRKRFDLDFVVVNGENAAAGFGITEKILLSLLDAGADVVTLGNHAFDQKDTLVYIERHERLLRPLNFPHGTPGRGSGVFKAKNGADVLVINAMGRVFMDAIDCPFQTIDKELNACALGQGADAAVIDFHAEATSEKQALGFHVDGRASVLVGTHTHTPTADARILPQGTAYLSDAGMCGDYDSVLGMDKSEPVNRFTSKLRNERFEPANGPASISGLAVEIDDATGLAIHVSALREGPHLPAATPQFWTEQRHQT